MRARLGPFGIFLAGAGVLCGSFWITLKLLDRTDNGGREATAAAAETVKNVSPNQWLTQGKASYELRGDTILMRGPNDIYADIDCPTGTEAEFSIDLDHAKIANMQLIFLDDKGGAISAPVIQDLSAMENKPERLSAVSPPGTSKVRVLIYSPQPGEAVTFKNPILRMHSS
jgi:hypothetical protein